MGVDPSRIGKAARGILAHRLLRRPPVWAFVPALLLFFLHSQWIERGWLWDGPEVRWGSFTDDGRFVHVEQNDGTHWIHDLKSSGRPVRMLDAHEKGRIRRDGSAFESHEVEHRGSMLSHDLTSFLHFRSHALATGQVLKPGEGKLITHLQGREGGMLYLDSTSGNLHVAGVGSLDLPGDEKFWRTMSGVDVHADGRYVTRNGITGGNFRTEETFRLLEGAGRIRFMDQSPAVLTMDVDQTSGTASIRRFPSMEDLAGNTPQVETTFEPVASDSRFSFQYLAKSEGAEPVVVVSTADLVIFLDPTTLETVGRLDREERPLGVLCRDRVRWLEEDGTLIEWTPEGGALEIEDLIFSLRDLIHVISAAVGLLWLVMTFLLAAKARGSQPGEEPPSTPSRIILSILWILAAGFLCYGLWPGKGRVDHQFETEPDAPRLVQSAADLPFFKSGPGLLGLSSGPLGFLPHSLHRFFVLRLDSLLLQVAAFTGCWIALTALLELLFRQAEWWWLGTTLRLVIGATIVCFSFVPRVL